MNEISAEIAAKRDRLLELLANKNSCVVAFSGGVDSSVLAKAAQLALGDRAVAVTASSASMPVEECDEAVELAGQIGIRHQVVETDQISNPDYQRNDSDRCYYCRIDIFKALSRGYLSETISILEPTELSNLVFGGKYLTYMQAVRFLTDYLNADIYYKTDYEDHNLVRTANQLQLLKSIEDQEEEMNEVLGTITREMRDK